MATIVKEVAREQDGVFTQKGWELTRVWNVQLDSVIYASIASVEAVRAQAAEIGDAHPQNPYAFLRSLTPAVTDNRKIWNVTGQYTQSTFAESENPLDEPKRVAWSSNTYTAPVVKDNDGNPIVNSAGQPFDPPLTEERHTVVATITYNSDQYDPNLGATFEDTVNEGSEKIANLTVPARTAKILEVGATQEFFEDIPYWAVTIKVEINRDTWDREVLDQGIFEKVGAETKRMSTDDGEEVTEPLKLDGSGAKLDPQTADPVYLTFKTLEEKDFGPLDLEIREET